MVFWYSLSWIDEVFSLNLLVLLSFVSCKLRSLFILEIGVTMLLLLLRYMILLCFIALGLMLAFCKGYLVVFNYWVRDEKVD